VPTYATNTTIVQSTTTAAEVVTEPLPAVVNEPPAIRYLGYTVRSGDSLSEIAERYNTTVVALRDINGIEGSTILFISRSHGCYHWGWLWYWPSCSNAIRNTRCNGLRPLGAAKQTH